MKKFINSLTKIQKQKKLTKTQLYLSTFSLLLFLTLIVTIPFLNSPMNKNQNITTSNAAGNGPLLGVYRFESPGNVDLFSAWLGRNVDFATAFEATDTWANISGPSWQLGPWGTWVNTQPGRKLALAVPMFPDVGGSLATCSNGGYNTYWQTLSNNLVSHNLSNTILRLGWEFNGDWSSWYATGHESDYIGCFRQIATTMRAAQPQASFKFDWNQTADPYLLNFTAYPGDAYVDYISADVYDTSWSDYPYPTPCDTACHTAHQQSAWNNISGAALGNIRDFAIQHGKQVSIPEWGLEVRSDGHGGGDNPIFMQNMYNFIMNPLNNVAYHSYFDVVAPDGTAQISPGNNNYQTLFPVSAALYKQLFGITPTATPPPPTYTPTPTNTPTPTSIPSPSPAPTNTPTPTNTPSPTPIKDTTSPIVNITSPTNGSTVYRHNNVTITASASDNNSVAKVQFSVNGSLTCTDTSSPYSCIWGVPNGRNVKYTLSAKAYDADGNTATNSILVTAK